ncbi:MAG: hypothetical protein EP326_05060 [Deltaproteobacteria bacterium]|nr:MAG: hypothetical protein EP326_05060 [Deltaproteobacteria bacterium]TNF24410.1 MAG: hypothetical protein EP319_18540 [Deltaproteobacteria bacterium]
MSFEKNFPKWWQTIKISWSNYTAYRMNFFLQIIGPALVFFFVKYNLWSSIYDGDAHMTIKGYNLDQMITYHIWSMIVGLVAQGMSALNLAEDIRMGRISSYLIYPIDFWEYHTAGFIAFETLQLFISALTITVIAVFGFLPDITFTSLIFGFTYCVYVSLFWFILQYLTGIIGFWLEETWILRVILSILTAFLSGAIIPLELYPEWLVTLLNYTPFPYLTFYPIKMFMGEIGFFPKGYLMLGAWMVILLFLNKWIWKKGIRMYTAAGM